MLDILIFSFLHIRNGNVEKLGGEPMLRKRSIAARFINFKKFFNRNSYKL
jgi:hypothetical protein